MTDPMKLTKLETIALWHSVMAMKHFVKAMKTMNCKTEQIEHEEAQLKVATRALRKVNKLRKQGL